MKYYFILQYRMLNRRLREFGLPPFWGYLLGAAAFLSLPVFLTLIVAFPDQGMILAGVMGIGYLYLLTILLAKYSVFPGRMTLPQELLAAFGIWFPPILLALIPYFYSQSLKKLRCTGRIASALIKIRRS